MMVQGIRTGSYQALNRMRFGQGQPDIQELVKEVQAFLDQQGFKTAIATVQNVTDKQGKPDPYIGILTSDMMEALNLSKALKSICTSKKEFMPVPSPIPVEVNRHFYKGKRVQILIGGTA